MRRNVMMMSTTTNIDTNLETGVTTETTVKKHDWWTTIAGICLVILGIFAFMAPGMTLVTLAMIIGIVLAVAGVAEIVAYFAYKSSGASSGWQIVGGICNLILAAIFLFNPVTTAFMLPWIAGVGIAIYGIFAIIGGIQLRESLPSSWGWFVANGVISIICAVLFWLFPESFVIFLAVFLVFRGITMAVFGWSTSQVSVTKSQS